MPTAVANNLGPFSKALVPLVVLALAAIADRVGINELDIDWETVALGLITAAGVYVKRNKPKVYDE